MTILSSMAGNSEPALTLHQLERKVQDSHLALQVQEKGEDLNYLAKKVLNN